uniref:Uncharacterized protein n=1 Tax=Glossina brevipalpis TaxID=37001 RepID=A0A1A9WLG1_9MUSC
MAPMVPKARRQTALFVAFVLSLLTFYCHFYGYNLIGHDCLMMIVYITCANNCVLGTMRKIEKHLNWKTAFNSLFFKSISPPLAFLMKKSSQGAKPNLCNYGRIFFINLLEEQQIWMQSTLRSQGNSRKLFVMHLATAVRET